MKEIIDYISDAVLSIYKSSSHDYSLSAHEFDSSIFTLMVLFFICVVLSVFAITTGVLMVKLHRCPSEKKETDLDLDLEMALEESLIGSTRHAQNGEEKASFTDHLELRVVQEQQTTIT